jgi:NAD(P)-dependent dehydrogenase (short-subunit alcohol dehydrogenase family)
MHISLEGKVALITGASRGIGHAMAKMMAESGAKVMMVSRKIDESATEGINGTVAVRAANVGDVTVAEDVVRETIEKFGGLDILVNNAATNPYFGATMEVDEGRYDKTFQVNLKGPVFWSQAVWRGAFMHKPGVIINVASVGGMRAEQGLGVYNLTKAALIH